METQQTSPGGGKLDSKQRRSSKSVLRELLIWIAVAPVVMVALVTIAKAGGAPPFLLGVGLVIFGIVAFSMVLKPSARLHIGRARAVGLIYAAMLGGGAIGPQTAPEEPAAESIRSLPVASPLPKPEQPRVETVPTPMIEPAKAQDAEDKAPPQAEAVPSKPVKAKSGWQYRTAKDEMRETTTRFATLKSSNQTNFGFPYPRSTASLIVRERSKDGLNIMLKVEGQFTCSPFGSDTVSVKFDDGDIEEYECSTSSDGSSDTIFIRGAQRFLEKLRMAEQLIVEAEFFQAGRHQIKFSPKGLEW